MYLVPVSASIYALRLTPYALRPLPYALRLTPHALCPSFYTRSSVLTEYI